MFDAIIKTLIPILKNQKYNKKKEKNSLILRLYDIGSNIIKGLIDLYSNYYNPYTGNDELEIFIQDIIDKNLFIFNDILNNVIDLDIIERGTDFFDNNWEDYTYDDIVHFCYKKDQKTIKDLNAGFIIVLANSAYFGFKKENELQLILEEEKNKVGFKDYKFLTEDSFIKGFYDSFKDESLSYLVSVKKIDASVAKLYLSFLYILVSFQQSF